MGVLEDLLKALDRIPIWRRLQGLPVEVDDLKSRIELIEQKLGDTWPPDICRLCGKRAARLTGSQLDTKQKGVVCEFYDCTECGERDFRYRKA
jgi:hypothetical protein